MPWPVYSERFHLVKLPGGYNIYTVPPQRRAVITTMNMYGPGGEGVFFELDIGTTPVVIVVLPATSRSGSFAMRLVLYAGEQLRAYMNSPGSLVTSGYLFSTSTPAAEDAAPANTWEKREGPEPKV